METKLPLRDEVLDLALVLRTDDPLDNEPEVQRRWLALMRKYPGKNALEMAADFLDALAPPSAVQSEDVPSGVTGDISELLFIQAAANVMKYRNLDTNTLRAFCAEIGVAILNKPRPTEQAFGDMQK